MEPMLSGRSTFWISATLLIILIGLSGCGRKSSPPPRPAPDETPRAGELRGIASWYGHPFHGRQTANGERYDMHASTAAHKTLPFNTVVKVRNLDNGRTTEVRINDRGPFVQGRIIDLSRQAAEEIRMIGPGTARVELTVLSRDSSENGVRGTDVFTYSVQVGSFRSRDNARRLEKKLDGAFSDVRILAGDVAGDRFYRVRVGCLESRSKARDLARTLDREMGIDQPTVVRGSCP